MPSLLIVTTIPATQGFFLPYAKHFRGLGWRVDGMANGVSEDAKCTGVFDHVWDADLSRNPLDVRNLARAAGEIRNTVLREGYDIVHVHTPIAAAVTRFALRSLRRSGKPKVIYTAHGFHFYRGGPVIKNLIFRTVERLAGRWTDHLIVINDEDFEAALLNRIVPPQRLTHMFGVGVDTEAWSPDKIPDAEIAAVRRELGLKEADSLFSMIAEFNPGKRHRDLLEALKRADAPGAHVAFAGVGREQEHIRRLAKDLELTDRVHFLGFRHDIPALIMASVATVLPSEREGLPKSVMESMSLGVPVIGTNIRGISDLLTDGKGLLVPLGDISELAKALQWVLSHPLEAKAVGQRSRLLMPRLDLKRILTQHADLYDRLLKDSKTRQSAG